MPLQEKKRWIVGILAISSLSLAAKMRNTDLSISLSHVQVLFFFFSETEETHAHTIRLEHMYRVLLYTYIYILLYKTRNHKTDQFKFITGLVYEWADDWNANILLTQIEWNRGKKALHFIHDGFIEWKRLSLPLSAGEWDPLPLFRFSIFSFLSSKSKILHWLDLSSFEPSISS